jgi:tetratricopeptide (TPR) repeat protein/tRNA A-37 threonylcarbamoyl transferase component Bud32
MDQTLERFHKIQTVFSLVVTAPESERLELLDTHCGSDSELEDEVRSMLDACAAEELLNTSLRSQPGNGATDRPQPGRVGPYEIDRLLGRGGMGSVYLAHRADGHFEQRVAIKFIDLPIGSHLFRERLRQERQILATLQHPYIARLLNGGVTEEGWPYLAMEYVDGLPIQRFSAEHKLTEVERIELFLRVSDAVQFAHQNFVVHRDLKPDNILVVADGTPRLLDFGTAKLVSPSLDKRDSELTRAGYLTYTPQYASPEQVLGKPITAATDTYSLGVLLYLLLTGTLPYRLEELTTAEMLRVVCEEPPPRPCLQSGKRLNGDLEAILLKALRKEPQDRYPTVEQLAKDLRDHLDGHPVAARRGTLRYRASKFAHRHRLILASAVVLAATLAAGVAAVGWQAGVANRERRKAEARSADLRQLNNSLLSELDDAIQQLPGSTNAQKLLITRVLEHLDRMANDARGDRETQIDLVDAYTRLANLQGNSYDQNLGDTQGALNSIGKAIALAQALAGQNSKDRDALDALARAQLARSEILFGTAPIEETIAATQASIATYDRLIALPGVTADELCQAGGAQGILGDELGINDSTSLNDPARALIAYGKDLDLIVRATHIDPNIKSVRWDLIVVALKIAQTEAETDPEQTLRDAKLGLVRIAALPGEEQQALKIVRLRQDLLLEEADALVQMGHNSEANAILAAVIQLHKSLVTADPQDTRALLDLETDLNQQAQEYELEADPELGASDGFRQRSLLLAASSYTEEIELLGKALKLNPAESDLRILLADAEVHLASIQSELHAGGDFSDLANRGLVSFRDLITANPSLQSAGVLDAAAEDFMQVKPDTLRNSQRALSYAQRAAGLSHRKKPSILLTLAKAYRATGQREKSRAAAQEGLALLPSYSPGAAKPAIRKQLEAQLR